MPRDRKPSELDKLAQEELADGTYWRIPEEYRCQCGELMHSYIDLDGDMTAEFTCKKCGHGTTVAY